MPRHHQTLVNFKNLAVERTSFVTVQLRCNIFRRVQPKIKTGTVMMRRQDYWNLCRKYLTLKLKHSCFGNGIGACSNFKRIYIYTKNWNYTARELPGYIHFINLLNRLICYSLNKAVNFMDLCICARLNKNSVQRKSRTYNIFLLCMSAV